MLERQQLRQLQMPTAVQRVPQMSDGQVRNLFKNEEYTIAVFYFFISDYNFKPELT